MAAELHRDCETCVWQAIGLPEKDLFMTRVTTLILVAASSLIAADLVTLRDGSRRYGTFIGSAGGEITFDEENGARQRYSFAQVKSIEFDAGSSSLSRATSSSSTTTSQTTTSRSGVYADPPASRVTTTRTIPAGTELQVRTNEAIQSESAAEGRIYTANVERDVLDNSGQIVVPRGASAQLVVKEMKPGGATSSPELALDLQSITMNGSTYYVSTEDLQRSGREGIGANKRTATMVGGAAVLGTLLGAIAGGGKGAAIGAIAGAAAGAGAQVLTRGKTVSVPAETVLTFRLDQPINLQTR